MQYAGVLRYQPTDLVESLAAPAVQYVYVDAQSTNGFYPDAQTFFAAFTQANPGLLSGACRAIAKLSDAVVEQSMSDGSSAPTVVISAYPVTAGSCTQHLNLGAYGKAQFSLTVAS